MKKYGIGILIASVVLFMLMMTMMGCAKLPSPTATSIEMAGVQGAAIYVGTQYPNTVPIILSVSNSVITAENNGITITPAQINAEVLRLEAASKLTVAEKAGINTFLVALQTLIAQELASNHIDINSNITTELCWVAQWAANILGGSGTCKIQPTLVSAPTKS